MTQRGQRRDHILKMTALMIAERGYAQMTTKELAQRAGVSEPLIFYHFKNKLGLLQALSEGFPVEFANTLERAQDLPIPEFIDLLAEAWGQSEGDGRFLTSLTRDATLDPEVHKVVKKVVETVDSKLKIVLQAQVRAGKLPDSLDIDLAVSVILQILIGSSIRTAVFAEEPDLEKQLELVFRGFA